MVSPMRFSLCTCRIFWRVYNRSSLIDQAGGFGRQGIIASSVYFYANKAALLCDAKILSQLSCKWCAALRNKRSIWNVHLHITKRTKEMKVLQCTQLLVIFGFSCQIRPPFPFFFNRQKSLLQRENTFPARCLISHDVARCVTYTLCL